MISSDPSADRSGSPEGKRSAARSSQNDSNDPRAASSRSVGRFQATARLALFKVQAEAALATVTEVEAASDVPLSIADFLRDHNLPATLRMGDDPRFLAMPWSETALDISHGPSVGNDLNAVSHAFGAVAETGSLVMISGSENPSTLNFLPDNHIIVVAEKDIAGDYESVWTKIRFAFGKGRMSRTVNWITGPSRSGDIEQTMLLGAHGPRRLHVIVVKE